MRIKFSITVLIIIKCLARYKITITKSNKDFSFFKEVNIQMFNFKGNKVRNSPVANRNVENL